jgi:predicted ATPase
MSPRSGLVGRRSEGERLTDAIGRARRGQGSIVLIGGEAGVGKTRLAEEVATSSKGLVLEGAASYAGTIAYGPVVAAFRSLLRASPTALDGCGQLRPHLALILPELEQPSEMSDRPTLFEAIRQALAHIA